MSVPMIERLSESATHVRLRRIFGEGPHSCFYCGEMIACACPSGGCPLTLDHVLPVRRGGRDRADNLVVACRACNSGKRDSLYPEEWMPGWLSVPVGPPPEISGALAADPHVLWLMERWRSNRESGESLWDLQNPGPWAVAVPWGVLWRGLNALVKAGVVQRSVVSGAPHFEAVT